MRQNRGVSRLLSQSFNRFAIAMPIKDEEERLPACFGRRNGNRGLRALRQFLKF
jgi:hypothetical protein